MADLNIFSMKPDTTLKEGVSLFNKNFSEVQSAIAETVTKSEAIIPNNDSTININLSSPGWYRIATFNVGDDDDKIGAVCNSCKIIIRRQFSDTDNEYHELMFINTYGSSKLLSNADKSNVQLFTKIRHTIDSNENNNAFLEVYYTGGENDVNLLLSDSGFVYNNISYFWKLIQPEFTEEIVDGVTIYSSLDIPANSSGTATYDENGNNIVNTYATNNGSNAAGTWNIDITGKSDTIKTVQLTNTADLDALKDVEFTLYYAANGNTINKNPELKQGFLLKVHRVSGADIAQELISQAGNTYVRYLHGTTWTAFKRVAYTTDNVASATKLQTPRKINGVEFDGSADIDVVDDTAYQKLSYKMDKVGWYRIFIGAGTFFNSILHFVRSWGTLAPESVTLKLSLCGNGLDVSVLSHFGAIHIDKIRLVQQSVSNAYNHQRYIDLHYNANTGGTVRMLSYDNEDVRGFKLNANLSETDATLNITPDELEEGYTSTEIDISKQGSYFPKSTIDELTVGSITGVNYAGSSSVGGSANSADKLNTNAGSATQPVYFKDGVPVATTYTLGKSVPSNAVFTDTTYSNFVKSGSGAKAGLVPAPSTTAGTTKYLREDGTWVVPPNTTYSAMTAATSSAAGKAGLVPAPAAGKQASFLRGDGTWVVPTNTKYTHPSYTARTGKPTANQTPAFGGTATVSQITSDATGHVTAATDRTITIPNTLSNGTGTAGLIKTTSTVTSNSGYTACPVISGVPYYKDTDTKYTHPTTAGNKHIPAGGASGQMLKWSAAGTAVWADNPAENALKADLQEYVVTANSSGGYGDFNTYLEPGIYVFSKSADVQKTSNAPSTQAGTLVVTDYTGGSKSMSEAYAYRVQEFHTHDNSGVYKRNIQTGSHSELIVGEWIETISGTSTIVTNVTNHMNNKNKPHMYTLSDNKAYCRKVIGLIDLNMLSYCGGTIELYRTNGVTKPSRVTFSMQRKYDSTTSFWCDYSATGFEEFNPVIFTYNGKTYAGFYYFNGAAQQENIKLDVFSASGTPFLVQVYDTSTSSVLNKEIYNSLQYNCFSSSGTVKSGNIEFTNSGTSFKGVYGKCSANDYWRVGGAGTSADNAGYMELATADDATEPIHVRQYSGAFSTLKRTLTLLDGSGNTELPGNLYMGSMPILGYENKSQTVYQSASATETASSAISLGNNSTMYYLNTIIRGYRVFLNPYYTLSASTNIATASDEKVKTFSDDIQTDEEKLVKLFDIIKPKSYSYNYSHLDNLNIGFSAQDIEKAMIELDIDPEKYGILNISYNHMLSRGDGLEDSKFYTKFYEVSYNDLFSLSLLKMNVMEKQHVARLESLEERLTALENK